MSSQDVVNNSPPARNGLAKMSLRAVVATIEKLTLPVTWSKIIGSVVICVMSLIITVDVILRYVFSRPIQGSNELIAVGLVAAFSFSLAYAQLKGFNINIDAVTGSLSKKRRVAMELTTGFLSILIIALVVWQTYDNFLLARSANRVTQAFVIPLAPFVLVLVIGAALLLIMLIRDFLNKLIEALDLRLGVGLWLFALFITLMSLAILVPWPGMTVWPISGPILGLIGFLVLLVYFFSGMPIGSAMLMVGFAFLAHLRGLAPGFDILGTALYQSTGNFTWAVLALFTLMGFLCSVNKLGYDAYWCAYRWVGHLPGGLGLATIGACTFYASIVGDAVVSIAGIGQLSITEMRRYKYSDKLAAGAICAGSTLGALIPPSMGFIIFGIVSGTSIRDLFIAGIFPGLIMATVFCIDIFIRCRLNPAMGPPGKIASWPERFISLRALVPIGSLFILVIGGIYAGIFTPYEAGGIGVVGTFLIALIGRRFTWGRFNSALEDTAKLVAVIFLILAGALVFSYFISMSTLPAVVAEYIVGLSLHPMLIIIIFMIILFILGCIMSATSIMLVIVPIFLPLTTAMGYNPIWIGVLVVAITNLGFITPPYAMGIFALKAIVKDVPIATIYSGVIPFVIDSLVVIALLVVFVPLSTWLPSLMR